MAFSSSILPVFPEDTSFQYLAEGAANIVYRISNSRVSTPEPSILEEYGSGTPPPEILDETISSESKTFYHGKLARFRKDLKTTRPCTEAQANWERLIKPLFPPQQIIDQTLVSIRPGTISSMNAELRDWEDGKTNLDFPHTRPSKRQKIYLANDEHALLITDMTPGTSEEVVEFKPKWLLQSPSAPKDSKRCRQCARMARLNASLTHSNQPPVSFFCPLDLTSPSPDQSLASLILPSSASPLLQSRFSSWLSSTSILQNLKNRQKELDGVGVMEGDVSDERFLAAMTLRDCTVFVRCTSADPGEWEERIGDLDLKSSEKIGYWRDVERCLIEEGWYQGRESEGVRQPIVCRLSRGDRP